MSVVAPQNTDRAGVRQLTIHVPLGASNSAAVFLVRDEATSRLLRLKTWRTAAPADFIVRFDRLRSRIADFGEPSIHAPLAGSRSAGGGPSVLSEFRQGMPLLDCVRLGRIDAPAALANLESLIAATRRAHAVGLIHGSVVSGNVMFDTNSNSPFLLDFGLNPLLHAPSGEAASASADEDGFARLVGAL